MLSAQTNSYRMERDMKKDEVMRHSIIFVWQTGEKDDPFPDELVMNIAGQIVRYKPTE